MSFLQEFRKFAMRGNIIDLGVGIIIGAAFNKIVSSLVANIMMPLLGLLIGVIDFKRFSWVLKPAHEDTPAVIIEYGILLQNIFDFIIVAFAVFCIIKLINKMHYREMGKPAESTRLSTEETLLIEIRDLLKSKTIL